MEYRTVNRQKLVDIVDPKEIVSILEVGSESGNSLAIAIKYAPAVERLQCSGIYGDFRRGRVIYLPLDKFTYHIPRYVALPRDLWDSIVIINKQVLFDSTETCTPDIAGKFIKATITKKVVW